LKKQSLRHAKNSIKKFTLPSGKTHSEKREQETKSQQDKLHKRNQSSSKKIPRVISGLDTSEFQEKPECREFKTNSLPPWLATENDVMLLSTPIIFSLKISFRLF
jgi:hypothetical protein